MGVSNYSILKIQFIHNMCVSSQILSKVQEYHFSGFIVFTLALCKMLYFFKILCSTLKVFCSGHRPLHLSDLLNPCAHNHS